MNRVYAFVPIGFEHFEFAKSEADKIKRPYYGEVIWEYVAEYKNNEWIKAKDTKIPLKAILNNLYQNDYKHVIIIGDKEMNGTNPIILNGYDEKVVKEFEK